MSDGDPKQVYGGYHFSLEIPDVDNALLFFQLTPPSVTIDGPDFKTWTKKGDPLNSLGGGRQVTYSDLQLSRGVDTEHVLYEWIKAVEEQGSTPDTKKNIKITALDSAGTPLHIWNIVGAVPTQYGHSGANAQTNEVLVENVTIKFESCTLEKG